MKRSFGIIKERYCAMLERGKIQNAVYTLSLVTLVVSLLTVTAMSIQKTVGFMDPAGKEYDTVFVVDVESDEYVQHTENMGDTLPAGGMLVKQKKYGYKDGNVMILDITNRTSNAYTITIDAHYLDTDGNVVRNEKRIFEGFPAGYSNYFVFDPGIGFSGFTFELSGIKFTGEAYAGYFTPGSEAVIRTCWGHADENGEYIIPIGEEQVHAFPRVITIDAGVAGNTITPCEKNLSVVGDVVVFDNNGEIYYIGDGRIGGFKTEYIETLGKKTFTISAFPPVMTDIPRPAYWPSGANINMWPVPEELSDATVLFAVKEVYPTYEASTKFPSTKQYWREP